MILNENKTFYFFKEEITIGFVDIFVFSSFGESSEVFDKVVASSSEVFGKVVASSSEVFGKVVASSSEVFSNSWNKF